MKRQLLIAVGLLSTLGSAVAAPTEKSLQDQGLKPLSSSELKEMLQVRVRKIRAITQRGTVWTTFQTDGSALAEWSAGTNNLRTLPGRVTIRDGQGYCAKWEGQSEYCLKWYKTGENEYKTFNIPNGEFTSEISFVD